MDLKEKIYKYIKEHKTLVFPNQIAADSWAYAYAKDNEGQAIFGDKLISWDTFRDSFKKVLNNYEQAQTVHRLVFTVEYLQKNKLPFLCPEKFVQAKEMFCTDIVKNLPYFKKTLVFFSENEVFQSENGLINDVRNITSAYEKFLEENKLYELSYLKPDFSTLDDKEVVFVFPGLFNDDFAYEVLNSHSIEIISEDEDVNQTEKNIEVYKNSLMEIRSVMEKIKGLLNEGVPARDIVITAGDSASLSWIVSEAERRNIKINLTQAKSLSSYNCGRFFLAIKNVIDEKWSVESVRDLLLDPAFPFKDRKKLSDLFLKAVENRVEEGQNASSWLYKLGRDETIMNSVMNKVNSFANAKTADALRQAIHSFEDTFFIPNPWTERAYSRCMKILDSLEKVLADKNFSYKPFDLFINLLQLTVYNPVGTAGLIDLYLYPVNAGMTALHMFCLGFDDESTRYRRKPAPFCEGNFSESGDKALNVYCLCKAELSCSEENFSSAVSTPFGFEEKYVERISEDSFTAEEKLYKGSVGADLKKCSLLQKKRFTEKIETVLKKRNQVISYTSEKLIISPSSIGDFVKCPFRWYLSTEVKLNKEDYEPDMADSLGVGILMHSCLEKWLVQIKIIDQLTTEEAGIFLKNIIDEEMNNYSSRRDKPEKAQVERLRLSLFDQLSEFANEKNLKILQGMSVFGTEVECEYETKDFYTKPRVDCVLKNEEGETAIIDFKKGAADTDSLQVEFYAKALMGKGVITSKPVLGAYYSVNKKKFVNAWKNETEFDERLKELDEVIKRMKECFDKNEAETTPSESNCEYCQFRSICRKRYVIR